MNPWQKRLKNLGFTESEANIYLAAIEMGPSSVQDLAKRAAVSRVTTYAVIEHLTKLGLMSTVQKGKKNLFVAETPDRLVSHFENKVTSLDRALKEMVTSINELKMVQRGEKPVVKLFEGDAALKAIQEDFLQNQHKEAIEVFNLDEYHKAFQEDMTKEHASKMGRNKHSCKVMYVSEGKDMLSENENVVSLKLPSSEVDVHGSLFIYGSKLIVSGFGPKPVSIVIESKSIAQMFKSILEHYWKLLHKK